MPQGNWGLSGTPAGNILHLLGIGPDARAGRQLRRVEDVMSGNGDPTHNYLNDPEGVTQQVMSFAPRIGIEMDETRRTREAARAKAAREAADEQTSLVSRYLRGLPEGADYGTAIDELTPYFTDTLGMDADSLASFREAVVSNPQILAGLDDEAYKNMAKDRYTSTVVPAGAALNRGDKIVYRNPTAPTAVTTGPGERTRVFNTNTGQFEDDSVTPAGDGGPQSFSPQGAPPPAYGAPPPAAPPPPRLQGAGGPGSAGPAPQTRVTASEARTIRQSMPPGPQGDAQFQNWLRVANVTVAPDGTDVPAAQSPTAPDTLVPRELPPAPPTRAITAPGGAVETRTSTYVPPKPEKATRNLTPDEVAALGYQPGTVVQEDSTGAQVVRQAPPKPGSGSNMTAQQRGDLNNRLRSLDSIESALDEVESLIDPVESGGWTGYVFGRVPGGLDSESDRFDKAVALLTSLIRQLTRTPGEGSMSDYESKLAAAIPPSRVGTDAGRDQAVKGMRTLLADLRRGYTEALEAGSSSAQTGGTVEAGTIIVGEDGSRYRYRGSGDTADIANYERIN